VRAVVIALLIGCGAPAIPREPTPRPAPYCFSLLAERFGHAHFSRACSDSVELCSFARERAFAFAEFAHFTEIGSCHVEAAR
jgi:hypothetical protein